MTDPAAVDPYPYPARVGNCPHCWLEISRYWTLVEGVHWDCPNCRERLDGPYDGSGTPLRPVNSPQGAIYVPPTGLQLAAKP